MDARLQPCAAHQRFAGGGNATDAVGRLHRRAQPVGRSRRVAPRAAGRPARRPWPDRGPRCRCGDSRARRRGPAPCAQPGFRSRPPAGAAHRPAPGSRRPAPSCRRYAGRSAPKPPATPVGDRLRRRTERTPRPPPAGHAPHCQEHRHQFHADPRAGLPHRHLWQRGLRRQGMAAQRRAARLGQADAQRLDQLWISQALGDLGVAEKAQAVHKSSFLRGSRAAPAPAARQPGRACSMSAEIGVAHLLVAEQFFAAAAHADFPVTIT